MTENEIKEYIEELRHKANTLIKSGYATSGISTHFNKSADLIEELLEYKLNGSFSGVELAQLAAIQMRLRDYQAIGTIEEFKALKEKSEPKKPTPIDYEKYMDVVTNAKFLRGACWCPNCKHTVLSGVCCGNCGQKLDWSE